MFEEKIENEGRAPEYVIFPWYRRQVFPGEWGITGACGVSLLAFLIFGVIGFSGAHGWLAPALLAFWFGYHTQGVWDPEDDEIDPGPLLRIPKAINAKIIRERAEREHNKI